MSLRWKALPSVLIALGGVFILVGCEKEPVRDAQTIRNMISYRSLGLAYLEEDQLTEAVSEFMKLIEIAPEEAFGYANLGLVYLRMGRYEEAEEQVKKALEREPQQPDIRLILAELYQLTNREDDALRELETTIRKDWLRVTIESTNGQSNC
ncbi:MAG: tetratricopeptide repeat protein [Bacteroidota bacterium]